MERSITLSGREIVDLARYAYFAIEHDEYTEGTYNHNFTISPPELEHVKDKQGNRHYFRHYMTEVDAEDMGRLHLGEKLEIDKPASNTPSLTLTGLEIKNLARLAGFSVTLQPIIYEDIESKEAREACEKKFLSVEYTIMQCPEEGITRRGDPGHTRHFKWVVSEKGGPKEYGYCGLGKMINSEKAV